MSGEARRRRLRALLKLSGADHVDPAAIEAAFVHESAARETSRPSNERLEFFGDAVLDCVAARFVYQTYPLAREGELARRKHALVSGEACARTARRLAFGELLVLGTGMQGTGGSSNSSILADAFEAYLAALYLATDFATVATFIEREHLRPSDRSDLGDADPKTALQEWTQAQLATMPVYFERAEGPPHDRRYTAQVRVGDEILGEGIGPSKKTAQQSAAAMALAALERRAQEAPAATSNEATPETTPESDGRVVAFRQRRRTPPQPTKPKAPI